MVDESDFKVIGITIPSEFVDPHEEAEIISRFLESGAIDLFHLRKPEVNDNYFARLMEGIPNKLYNRLVLHSHFYMADIFKTGGYHVKNNRFPVNDCFLTRSCHTFNECSSRSGRSFRYSFLSPIFDSISKEGYGSNFSLDDKSLLDITKNNSIVALGGVTPEKFKKLFDAKFAGAALLGYLWSPNKTVDEKINEIRNFRISIYRKN